MRQDGFTLQELAASKAGLIEMRITARSTDESLVAMLTDHILGGRSIDVDEEIDRRIGAATLAEVNAAVRTYIDPARLVIVRAGDFAATPPRPPNP